MNEIIELELETETLPIAEVAGLRVELYAKISEALAWGVFNNEKASEWEAGFEACTEIEHMENLVEIIDEFIDSGRELIYQLETTLANEAFIESERQQKRSEVEQLSFRAQEWMLRQLSDTVDRVEKQRQKLVVILSNSHHISSETAKRLLGKFVETESERKEIVLDEAVQLELKNTAEYRRLNRETQDQVRQLILAGELDSAEQMLGGALPKVISVAEYVSLRGELDIAQIREARANLVSSSSA
ncbi:hypothetical protein A3K24_03165 [candidate division Kazan bacterium RIFCSPHIGHO2_01_FULL_44_14]|uniref:Uncharacterized protein n=1 Tax=candidate division Kazan bacterium RIFCSPLOWO2_01_FULL_45_19 TaxID=1798538 RepID=A0A1F4NRB8_UNCK3|nr:hypothetical protein [uncultured bacterium]OGB73798.1 MAG: hypothetical protein A3K51_03165 [candidate division Kazan bacterium RIFCSPLOWO2_01_FULL_45_19]OGB78043.1 MAG: hypothetical protein A3K24_03165 [candidate division Kazan bacterium RIFCSPHIGHO2_01_FULL_44_14]